MNDLFFMGQSFVFSGAITNPATWRPCERKQIGLLKRIRMDTEVFTELTKENPPHVEMRIVSLPF